MRSSFVILVVVCFMGQSNGTFADFMNNLPNEISRAFSIAWGSLEEAIKQPVKLRRLGAGGKLKTSSTVRPITWEQPGDMENYITKTENIPKLVGRDAPEETSTHDVLVIPYIEEPKTLTFATKKYVFYDVNQGVNRIYNQFSESESDSGSDSNSESDEENE